MESYSSAKESAKNKEIPKYTIETFSIAVSDLIAQNRKRMLDEGANENEIQLAIWKDLENSGHILGANENSEIVKSSESIGDNRTIFQLIERLTNEFGIKNESAMLDMLISKLNIAAYTRDELLEIINNSKSFSIATALVLKSKDVLFTDKSSMEIVNFCTDIIKKFPSEMGYVSDSAHRGPYLWTEILKYIDIGSNLDDSLNIGDKLGDEFVWSKILKARSVELMKLSRSEKIEVAGKIIKSIQTKRGTAIMNAPQEATRVDQFVRYGFGEALSALIVDIIYSDNQ